MHVDTCVAVVDDNEMKRETLQDELELSDWKVLPFKGPFQTLEELTSQILESTNVAICDHHLVRNYAAFNGAAGVASLYQKRFPAILVTQYDKAQMLDIRFHRRAIPVLLRPDDADPDRLARGWETCRNEFKGKFLPTRESWRAMLRIDDVVDQMVYVLLPGWNSDEIISLPIGMFPENLHPNVNPGARFFASVNKGAEDQAELFFEEFEYKGK